MNEIQVTDFHTKRPVDVSPQQFLDTAMGRAEERHQRGLALEGFIEIVRGQDELGRPDGRIVQVSRNTVTRLGRLSVVEHLFGVNHTGGPTSYNHNGSRSPTISGFAIGSGGGSSATPSAADTAMTTSVTFWTGAAAPSGATAADYWTPATANGDRIYKKYETSGDEWLFDAGNDRVGRKIVLKIDTFDTSRDGGGTTVNEAGLIMDDDTDADDVNLYSRVAFADEVFTGLKTLSINYYVYT